jgi:hypothetical protein
MATVRAHRAVALDQRLVADQPGAQLQRGQVGQAGEEQLGPVAMVAGTTLFARRDVAT